jgi:LAS superfamily LD-carboxypeptidase LdcB
MAPVDPLPTRRSLHRAPAPVETRAARRRARGAARTRAAARLSFPAVAAATATAFVLGGVCAATLDTAEREQRVAALQAAEAQARADRAATVRLTAAAARSAAARQTEALAAAQVALAEAQTVLARAPALVGAETVSPLDEAVAQLADLLAAVPPSVVAVAAAADDTVLAAVADGPAVAVSDVEAGPVEAEPEAVEAPAPAVAAGEQTGAGAGDVVGRGPEGSPASRTGVRATAASDVRILGASAASAEPTSVGLAVSGVGGEVLDLETSDRVLAVAHQVQALTTQVKVLADAIAAELADAEEAAAARRAEEEAKRLAAERAALEAALRRLSTRIAATDAAPNGQIPVELLCRPRFSRILLRCDAAQALDRLNEAYRAAFGRDLAVSGGYRSLAEQEVARATKGDLAAQPGTSMHGRGLAVDFSGFGSVGQFDDPDYLWMVENGPAYGWVHPPAMGPGGSGPLEPWHWEYTGGR